MTEVTETQSGLYFEDKLIKDAVVVEGETTPLGDPVYLLTFEDWSTLKVSQAKYKALRTTEKSDATKARNSLVEVVGKKLYAIMMEYGLKLSEVDPVLNETVRLVNDGQNLANDTLWGNTMYDRSLLDVNRVLLTKYAEPETPAKEPENGDNGASPDGSVADSANPQ